MEHPNRSALRLSQSGFTLIEVMIVVAIIGILAAVALPSYKESVAKSRRVDVQRTLMEAEQFMRRYYSAKDTYVGATLPSNLAKSPSEPAATAYNIALDGDEAATTFTLKATRTGSMASDRCGDLTVTHTGKRTISGESGSATVEDCFKGS